MYTESLEDDDDDVERRSNGNGPNMFLSSLDADARVTDEAHEIEKRSDEFYVVYPASLEDDDDDDVERRANGKVSICSSFSSLLTYSRMS